MNISYPEQDVNAMPMEGDAGSTQARKLSPVSLAESPAFMQQSPLPAEVLKFSQRQREVAVQLGFLRAALMACCQTWVTL